MGLQRHLKAIGVFARLKHRDAKPGYLADISCTLDYVYAVAAGQAGLAPLAAGVGLAGRHAPTLGARGMTAP